MKLAIRLFAPALLTVTLSAQISIESGSGVLNGHQTVTDPGPQQPAEIAPGKGVLSGRVVNAKTKEPIKKARVSLNGPTNLSAVTDGSGAFTFRALPPGGYMVMANHDDFYLDQRGFNVAQQIVLADGEEKQGAEVALMPGASISGRVVDDDELPVPQCSIAALRFDRSQGRPRVMSNNGANTDDQGVYHLRNLQSGRYVLKAQCQVTFPSPHGFMRRNDPLIPHEGYAPVLIGEGDPASPLAGMPVTAGGDLSGMDFRVKRMPVYIVRGVLSGLDAANLPAAQVLLLPASAQFPDESFIPANFDPARAQFTFRHVPAGMYELIATAFNSEQAYYGRQTIEVGKTQLTEFEVKVSPGMVLAGTLDVDDPNQRFDNMQLSLQPTEPGFRGPIPVATLSPGGAFEFRNVLPGHFRLNPLPMGYVKSFTLGGNAVSPQEFEIAQGATGPVHISVGSKTAKLEVEFSPKPAAGQFIAGVLIPDEKFANLDGRNIAMSGPSGEMTFQGVPPGKYRVLVIPTANSWPLISQPQAVQALENNAVAVDLAEGDDKHVVASVVAVDDLQKALDGAP